MDRAGGAAQGLRARHVSRRRHAAGRGPGDLRRRTGAPVTAIASWVDGGTVDPVRAGHKAVSLAAMAAAGLPVPRGFVVLAEVVDSADDELPRAVADEITSAYRALGSPVVAVRSSATAEDLEGASFAGQYDTVLGVRGDKAVCDAVITVRRSLRSERAVAYR
ncbi:MAG: hypothetical protein JF603_15365, partial [Acidobacteria bacterium]|nr:hypothetical protein [Acidobacteriota bacterium]